MAIRIHNSLLCSFFTCFLRVMNETVFPFFHTKNGCEHKTKIGIYSKVGECFSENSCLSTSIITGSTPISSFSANQTSSVTSAPIACMHVTELTSVDLPNRPREPLARRDEPKAKRVQNYNSDSDRCIVKRLRIDRVKLR